MKKIILMILIISSFDNNLFSQKYEKLLQKAEDKYEGGYYEKALDKLEKFEKAIQKLGDENKYTPIYFLKEAEYHWASGLVQGFDQSLENAAESAKNVHGEFSEDHLHVLLEIAHAYIRYGNFNKAQNYLQKVQEELNNKTYSEDLQARSRLFHGWILSEQGYYHNALSEIIDAEPYFKGRLNVKENYIDSKGKTKTRRLSETELKTRYSDYANILSFKAKTYGQMGDLDKAYEHYEFAREWIKKQNTYLGDRSLEYIQHQFSFAQFKVSNGLDPDLLGKGDHKEEGYSRILSQLKKGHNEGHIIAFGIYEAILTQYLIKKQASRYRNQKIEYRNAISGNFHKNSLHYINLEKLDFNSQLDRDKMKNLEDQAHSLLANTQALPKNHAITRDILQFLYRVAIKNRTFDRAEEYMKDIINIQIELYGEESPITHLARIHLANFYVDYTNKIQEAESIYNNSFYSIFNKEITPMHPDYLDIITHIASLKEYQDNYAEARELLDEAVDVALQKFRDPEDLEYARILESVASLEVNIGEYEKADININKVLEIYDKKKLKRDDYNVVYLVKAQETKARLDIVEGYFDQAEDLIKDSQNLLDDAKTLEGYNSFEIDDELAGLYIFLGYYNKSEDLLNELIEEYERVYGPQSGKIIKTLINKGRLEILLGNYNEAEKFAQRANSIATDVYGENSTKTAKTHLLLGELYTALGDYEKAVSNFSKTIEIEEKRYGRKHIDVAIALSQLAVARLYNNEDYEIVEKIMLEARETIGSVLSTNNPRYAEANINLAKIYIRAEKYDEAFQILTEAQNIWVEITGTRSASKNVNIGKIDALAGDLYYQMKNFEKAETHYKNARNNFNNSLNKNHPEYIKIQTKLSRLYFMEGNSQLSKDLLEEAISSYNDYIDRYFKSLSEREKAKFWNTIKPDFEFYNTVAISYLDKDPSVTRNMYNNALKTKALLLSSSIKIRARILNSGDEDLIKSYQEWLDKKEELTRAFSVGQNQSENSGLDIDKLSQEVETLERSLSEKSELFSSEIEKDNVTWNDIKSSLNGNEVAIEMVRYRHFDHVFTDSVIYAVLYVTGNTEQKEPSVILMKNGEQMEGRFLTYYNNVIQNRFEDNNSYKAYWEPIVSEIGSSSTIYLSADGVYNQINLETIPLDDGKYVLDNSNIVLVNNTKDIYLREKSETKTNIESALMFGNPNFYLTANNSGKIFELPGTEREVQQLRSLLGKNGINSDYFTQDEATEDQVKAVEGPSILHIATHGFADIKDERSDNLELNENANNPLLKTGLIMTGGGDVMDNTTFNYNMDSGILTAYEAMNLNLDATDLVVLSACETGKGKLEMGEGVYGLQRAFLVAGANTMIMSLYKVNDTATQELMVSFYRKWMETGNKRQAFVDAKKEIRNKYEYPIFWGAFIMIGLDK